MSPDLANVSVVIPTLNSAHLIEPVMGTLRGTLASVGEVIVVDSHSEDGTLELLKEGLGSSNVRYLSHPRGLYASWNFGIANTSKEWIYIATAGDAITVEDLVHLRDVGAETGVDVVCSPPQFVNEAGEPIPDLVWPILDLLEDHEGEDLVFLSKDALLAFSLIHGRPRKGLRGWLGSSASNLYRSEVLKSMPFPTEVGRTGDTYWGVRNAGSLSAVFCRRRCGRFVVHEKCVVSESISREDLVAAYEEVCLPSLHRLVESNPGLRVNPQLRGLILDLVEQERLLSEALLRSEKGKSYLKSRLDGCKARVERSEEALRQARRAPLNRLRKAVGRFASWVLPKGRGEKVAPDSRNGLVVPESDDRT